MRPGATTRPRVSSSASRVRATSRTSCASRTSRGRWRISSPRAYSSSARSSGPSCGSSRRRCGTTRERFEEFLALLPRDTSAALRLARRRDARMHGRSRLRIDAAAPAASRASRCGTRASRMRISSPAARAQRSRSWWPTPRASGPTRGRDRRLHVFAAAWRQGAVRERIHGRGARSLGGSHPCVAARRGAARCPARAAGAATRVRARDVFCYFDNDVKVRAPFDADRLMSKLDP